MEEVTKKVAPGKINHKNAIKSCQIVLFSSKTVAWWFAKHSETEKWTKNADFCNSMLLNYLYHNYHEILYFFQLRWPRKGLKKSQVSKCRLIFKPWRGKTWLFIWLAFFSGKRKDLYTVPRHHHEEEVELQFLRMRFKMKAVLWALF